MVSSLSAVGQVPRARRSDCGPPSLLRAARHVLATITGTCYRQGMEPRHSELILFLVRVRQAVAVGAVRFTDYADEGIEALGWQQEDALQQLVELVPADLLRCEEGLDRPGLIWIFTPEYWDGGVLWIRLTERNGVLVISFHKG